MLWALFLIACTVGGWQWWRLAELVGRQTETILDMAHLLERYDSRIESLDYTVTELISTVLSHDDELRLTAPGNRPPR